MEDDLKAESEAPLAAPIRKRVSLLIHAPRLPDQSGAPLWRALGWNDPDSLVTEAIADLQWASHDIAHYEIVERIQVDGFPWKADGFRYELEAYLAAWRARSGFHQPDAVDYGRLLDAFSLAEKVQQDRTDEIWLLGFPYAGYYESLMAGPGAFWCNAPPLPGYGWVGRRFVVMGFNYERGVGEMLEDFGHRLESIMAHVYRDRRAEDDMWARFIRHERTHPGRSEMGNVHFAPNSERDYDWGNRRPVMSGCDHWYRYPDLEGEQRLVDCREWGGGDIRAHHRWWLHHLPHMPGSMDGIENNWWSYLLDPNLVV